MDSDDRTSEHEGRSRGASKGARRSGVENAVRRAWRNALADLAGRDQGIPRQRGSAAVADHEGGRDQAGVNGRAQKIRTLSKKPTSALTHSSARFSTLRQHMPT